MNFTEGDAPGNSQHTAHYSIAPPILFKHWWRAHPLRDTERRREAITAPASFSCPPLPPLPHSLKNKARTQDTGGERGGPHRQGRAGRTCEIAEAKAWKSRVDHCASLATCLLSAVYTLISFLEVLTTLTAAMHNQCRRLPGVVIQHTLSYVLGDSMLWHPA